jgi:Fic family protein
MAKSSKSKSKGKSPAQASLLAEDKEEPIERMEPLHISESSRWRGEINELVVELTYKAAGFKASLPPGVLVALRDLVRNMNCYYSNLIEGHNTHPIAIERALNEVYDSDPKKRNLQLEAKAHIAVQRWIDGGNLPGEPTSEASIREIHRRFVNCLPDELRCVIHPKTGKKLPVVPGEYREDFVQVGRHIPISAGAVPRFMRRYEEAYSKLKRAEAIVACAAAHHRFAWIHPFLDGNGRVVRLVSHAMMLNALDTGGVWSIARGLARSVEMYKGLLAECDLPRRNDLDGRGNLSEEALVDFTKYFLGVCIDQVNFMSELMQPDQLRARVLTWAEEQVKVGSIAKGSALVLEAVLFRGELPRSDVQQLVGSERSASRIANQLNGYGVITSSSSRAPWRLALPATLAPRWFPGLYPPPSASAA